MSQWHVGPVGGQSDGDTYAPGEIIRWLSRVEGRFARVVDDHEGRIRALERRSYVLVALAATGLSSALADLIDRLSG